MINKNVVRYCLKGPCLNIVTVFPGDSKKRKSNNDNKHGHGHEKRIPSTLCWGKKDNNDTGEGPQTIAIFIKDKILIVAYKLTQNHKFFKRLGFGNLFLSKFISEHIFGCFGVFWVIDWCFECLHETQCKFLHVWLVFEVSFHRYLKRCGETNKIFVL